MNRLMPKTLSRDIIRLDSPGLENKLHGINLEFLFGVDGEKEMFINLSRLEIKIDKTLVIELKIMKPGG